MPSDSQDAATLREDRVTPACRYTEAFRYLEEQGMKICGQPRTCYIDGAWNQEDPEKWVSLIQIPIE